MDRGWVKIYRSLLDWEWFDDAETVKLFIYILLSANYEDKKWRGMVVERGQYVTSLGSLSEILGMSVKRVRIRLERLTKSGAITTSGANRFTTITICNYDTYQDAETEKDTLRANRGQTKGKQTAPKRASKRANEFNTLTPYDCDTYEYQNDDKGQAKGQTKGKQTAPKRATTKEDKKIRSLSKEEVADATSKKKQRRKQCDEKGRGRGDPPIPYEQIMQAWNEETGGALGKIVMISGQRREMVRARIRETSLEDFFTMIRNAAASDFLRGDNPRGWTASFDWCIRPNKYPRVLEGNYRNKQNGSYGLDRNEEGGARDSSEGRDYTRYTDLSEYLKEHPDKR